VIDFTLLHPFPLYLYELIIGMDIPSSFLDVAYISFSEIKVDKERSLWIDIIAYFPL
jgi:hypothetical protein